MNVSHAKSGIALARRNVQLKLAVHKLFCFVSMNSKLINDRQIPPLAGSTRLFNLTKILD